VIREAIDGKVVEDLEAAAATEAPQAADAAGSASTS
jgi:hypothetical protein